MIEILVQTEAKSSTSAAAELIRHWICVILKFTSQQKKEIQKGK